jgi:hypothetical protein
VSAAIRQVARNQKVIQALDPQTFVADFQIAHERLQADNRIVIRAEMQVATAPGTMCARITVSSLK